MCNNHQVCNTEGDYEKHSINLTVCKKNFTDGKETTTDLIALVSAMEWHKHRWVEITSPLQARPPIYKTCNIYIFKTTEKIKWGKAW